MAQAIATTPLVELCRGTSTPRERLFDLPVADLGNSQRSAFRAQLAWRWLRSDPRITPDTGTPSCSARRTSSSFISGSRRSSVPNRCQESVSRIRVVDMATHVFHDDFAHRSEVVRAHGLHRRRSFCREP